MTDFANHYESLDDKESSGRRATYKKTTVEWDRTAEEHGTIKGKEGKVDNTPGSFDSTDYDDKGSRKLVTRTFSYDGFDKSKPETEVK